MGLWSMSIAICLGYEMVEKFWWSHQAMIEFFTGGILALLLSRVALYWSKEWLRYYTDKNRYSSDNDTGKCCCLEGPV
ncbi:hypothetical protein AAG747_26745 [Rapidithrix thailandica]|uniref:Uncharacterized protein n=1 Tax=Rapidithrix thailandica TaxID=413964 RepID=A0AAW9SCB0_9BACT